ncbi:MAG: ComEA family DNA-binding protein [Ilumatobacter sp.]|nr:ComEA family DNA-binding protein [Ilumatobacter sp.]
MSSSELQHPPRPEPPRRRVDTLAAWLAWFGLGRLVASAVCVVIVLIGVAWLVRVPPPPTEAGLPVTGAAPGTGPVTPASTLPTPPTAPTTTPALISVVVHVAGAVERPGVHQLTSDARVDDAIRSAGGPTAEADLDGLNLAAGVVDGQRIYVPVAGEVDPATVPSGTSAVAAAEPMGPSGPIDLNVATAAELETLPGVGPATAAAIVDDRERNGPFASVDDLDRVPGIGRAKLAAVADLVTV